MTMTPTMMAPPAAPAAALRRMFEHLAWADARALASLRSQASVHPRALELLAHLAASEHVWLARIEGRTPLVPVWPTLDLDQCESLDRETHARFRALLGGLDAPGALGRVVTYRNSAGSEFASSVEDILLHVVLHGSYHRGQIALLVRDAGDAPQPTDYIAFVRGAPAATRVPSGA